MSNSALIAKKRISPYKDSPRNSDVYIITPHCYVGKVSIDDAGDWFQRANCSCNYYDGG